jgi:hypothetical protein
MSETEGIIFQITTRKGCQTDNGCAIYVRIYQFNLALCNSIKPDEFKDYIHLCTEARKKKVLDKNYLTIDVSPEFASVFRNSSMVSSKSPFIQIDLIDKRGRSHLLLNTTKRDKRLEEEAKKQVDLDRNKEMMEDMTAEIAALKEVLDEKEKESAEHNKNSSILHELFEKKVIDKDGNLL